MAFSIPQDVEPVLIEPLLIVEGAGHLFEEPGTMDEVIRHATDWFVEHLGRPAEGERAP